MRRWAKTFFTLIFTRFLAISEILNSDRRGKSGGFRAKWLLILVIVEGV
jgi:hypothetical protein